MGRTIKTSRCSLVIFLMRSPVAMSKGCAPVLASYSAITLFTSSMSAVAGSYSRRVVSRWDENVTIVAFMFGLLRDVHLRSSVEQRLAGFGSLLFILHRFSELSRHHECLVEDGQSSSIHSPNRPFGTRYPLSGPVPLARTWFDSLVFGFRSLRL